MDLESNQPMTAESDEPFDVFWTVKEDMFLGVPPVPEGLLEPDLQVIPNEWG